MVAQRVCERVEMPNGSAKSRQIARRKCTDDTRGEFQILREGRADGPASARGQFHQNQTPVLAVSLTTDPSGAFEPIQHLRHRSAGNPRIMGELGCDGGFRFVREQDDQHNKFVVRPA